MNTTHTINVTQIEIDNGVRKNCRLCPIARAAVFCLCDMSAYAGLFLFVDRPEGKLSATLPNEAIRFMSDFDAGLPVKPFSFTVTFNRFNTPYHVQEIIP